MNKKQAITTKSARDTLSKLETLEVESVGAQKRRIMSSERCVLMTVIQAFLRGERTQEQLDTATAEADRVIAMWASYN